MIGWALFMTLLILVLGVGEDAQSGFGNSFGYPSKGTNWSLTWFIITTGWIVLILFKIGMLQIHLL